AVDRLETLARCVLPAGYREFLLTMGEDAGGLQFSNDDAMTIGEMIQYYEERERGEAAVPLNCVVIAWGGAGYDEQQLSLACHPANGSPVFVSNGAQIVGVYADSLDGLLFRRAFEQYRVLPRRV